MADTVDIIVMQNSGNLYQARWTNVSDATGETDVVKIDKSALTDVKGLEPYALDLVEITWSIQGFTSVRLEWDHTTDDEILMLTNNGVMDFRERGYLRDPVSAGGTGDVLLTTAGAASGATYSIVSTWKLRPAQ